MPDLTVTEEQAHHPAAADRKNFEERVYDRYFISQVKRTGLGGPCEFMPAADIKTKDELTKRDKRATFTYVDKNISAMWFGWCLANEHASFSSTKLIPFIERSMSKAMTIHDIRLEKQLAVAETFLEILTAELVAAAT